MAKKCEDITIIGGGLIGLFLAPILAKLNFKVALVDKEKIAQKTNIEHSFVVKFFPVHQHRIQNAYKHNF